jgi:CMP-N,N'-diacetyllegionaminic acid synthase
MNIAIIPARSESKGLPHKNIKCFSGKPLISHSIQCAIESGIFDEIYVSTDSRQYADIAIEYGASVPFLRKNGLAEDTSSIWDVVIDALLMYKETGKIFDMVTLLQPTSPLRIPFDIIKAYQLYNDKSADSVISVCEVDYLPYLCNTLPTDRSMQGFLQQNLLNTQRQQYAEHFRINGALYMVKCSYFENNSNIYGEKSFAYIMPKERSVDIDDEWDFVIAQELHEKLKL